MPIINLKISGEYNDEKTKSIVNEITKISNTILRKKIEVTAITVDYVPHHLWFVGMKSLKELNKNSFYLDTKITIGTNVKDEKSAFIEETYTIMEKYIGNLHEESYVYVEEVYGDAYGFGGRTQEYRYIKSKLT